jgi:hypothetical protein
LGTTGESGCGRQCFRNGLIHNQDGFALLFILLMIPVLVAALIFVADINQAVTNSDFDLKDTLDLSIRAANYQVDDRSQAEGNAHVNGPRAHETFRSNLIADLKLDPETLAPQEGSPLKAAPKYIFIVYNGDDAYSAQGCPAGTKYSFDGNSLVQTNLATQGFPCTFAISENDVTQGTGGLATVELESRPGCVAWIKAKGRKIIGNDPIEATRWMASEIHYWN